MTDPNPTYDASPCHYETVPIGALSAKSHALQDALRRCEELERENANLKRRLNTLVDNYGTMVGGKDDDAPAA